MFGSMRDVCATISTLHSQWPIISVHERPQCSNREAQRQVNFNELTLLTLLTQCIEATQQEDLGG